MKLTVAILLIPSLAFGQADICDPMDPDNMEVQTTVALYAPYPTGMRVRVGAQGVFARNTADPNGTCGADNHVCTPADLVVPNTYGVIQSDPPVLDPAGWYWSRIVYQSGVTGWSSAYSPIINMTTPPQMVQNSNFQIVGDYVGSALTGATCVHDGVNSSAIMQFQPTTNGVTGTLRCPVNSPPLGNHIMVILAINAVSQTPSAEFQYAVTAMPVPVAPAAPANLRIGPVNEPVAVRTAPNPK